MNMFFSKKKSSHENLHNEQEPRHSLAIYSFRFHIVIFSKQKSYWRQIFQLKGNFAQTSAMASEHTNMALDYGIWLILFGSMHFWPLDFVKLLKGFILESNPKRGLQTERLKRKRKLEQTKCF